MGNLKKRIEALEADEAQRYADKTCICYRVGIASFHTHEECDEATKIPCPIHGFKRWKLVFVGALRLTDALEPQDRHLCHCPPMRSRTAIEQGYNLTPEEEKLAGEEYIQWLQSEEHDEWERLKIRPYFDLEVRKREAEEARSRALAKG